MPQSKMERRMIYKNIANRTPFSFISYWCLIEEYLLGFQKG